MKDIEKIKRFVNKRGMSLVHQETYSAHPKDEGLLTWCSKFMPRSFQTKRGKVIRKKMIEELKDRVDSSKFQIIPKSKELEVFIVYKLFSKNKVRDIDNYTKNLLDCMKKIIFEDDSQIRLLVCRKDHISLEKGSSSKGLEKAIVRIDDYGKSRINGNLSEMFSNNKTFAKPR